jgi:hypothetical protein
MRDPVRMRELSPDVDAALDDPALDPPLGMEDAIWGQLEGALDATSYDASSDDVDTGIRPLPSRETAAVEAARSVPPPALPFIGATSSRSLAPRFVIGALAIAAASLLAIRSSETKPTAPYVQPTVVASSASHADDATSAARAPEPPPVIAPVPLEEKRAPIARTVKATPTLVPPPPTAAIVPVVAPPPVAPEKVAAVPRPVEPASTAREPDSAASVFDHKPAPANALLGLEGGDLEGPAAVVEIRALVQANQGARALARLDDFEKRFPANMMHEERDALRVRAFILVGKVDRAADCVAAFAEAHPTSPMLAQLRQLVTNAQPMHVARRNSDNR